MRENRRIGHLLQTVTGISEQELGRALDTQKQSGRLLGQVLIDLGLANNEQVLQALASQFRIPFVRLRESDLDPKAMALVPSQLVFKHQAVPYQLKDGALQVVVSNPLNIAALDDIRLVTGLAVEPVLGSVDDIRLLIEEHYMKAAIAESEGDIEILDATPPEGPDDSESLVGGGRETLVIKLVNLILRQAVQDRASDVHIEPYERGLKVRFRIDGMLHEVPSPAKRVQAPLISRIKIMADMDITERRLPQDGRIKLRAAGREVDVRVSTVPTLFGESVVMRILDQTSAPVTLGELGMLSQVQRAFERLIKQPYGIILATGPTGSGKSTSLYAALRQTAVPEKKVITIEDPIEYRLDGVTQIQVRPKIGLTFAQGLRHILRQDPDIVMVGEIRDAETAAIAIHAALTGHLVFSTLHTNDAASAVARLVEMEIEPYLVTSALIGVLGQRLVRMICNECKDYYDADDQTIEEMAKNGIHLPPGYQLMHGVGCEACKRTGYRGRVGVYELLIPDENIRRLTLKRAPADALREAARARGMRTMREDGWEKVALGNTTAEEVIRVSQEETSFDDLFADGREPSAAAATSWEADVEPSGRRK